MLFQTIELKFCEITVTVIAIDMRLLPRHLDDAIIDERIINNNIIGFTETKIKPSDSTCKIK